METEQIIPRQQGLIGRTRIQMVFDEFRDYLKRQCQVTRQVFPLLCRSFHFLRILRLIERYAITSKTWETLGG